MKKPILFIVPKSLKDRDFQICYSDALKDINKCFAIDEELLIESDKFAPPSDVAILGRRTLNGFDIKRGPILSIKND